MTWVKKPGCWRRCRIEDLCLQSGATQALLFSLKTLSRVMSEISEQLLYQRLRNRIIEELDHASSLKSVSEIGSFETIDGIFDFLPIDFHVVPELFDLAEQDALALFLIEADKVRSETRHATWDLAFFEQSSAWIELSQSARKGLAVFMRRGRFSEDVEERLVD